MTEKEPPTTAYLRFALKETGWSATALAKRAGIAATTLTRPLNDPNHKFELTSKTVQRIAAATGIDPGPFLSLHATTDDAIQSWHKPGGFIDQQEWFTSVDGEAQRVPSPRLTVFLGEVAPGVWIDPKVVKKRAFASINLQFNTFGPERAFVCSVRGNSINKIANDGELLFCSTEPEVEFTIRDGSLLIIERRSRDGSLLELSAREAVKVRDGWELRFASTDSEFDEVLVGEDVRRIPGVRVAGHVAWVIRSPHKKIA